MTSRIYIVEHNDTERLIRATSQAAARSFVAQSTISVKVASVADAIRLTNAGIQEEDASPAPKAPEVNPNQLPLTGVESAKQAAQEPAQEDPKADCGLMVAKGADGSLSVVPATQQGEAA